MSLLDDWLSIGKRVYPVGEVTMQWCARGETPRGPPSSTFLPVHVYDCPDNFSTVEYFDNLTSKSLGRLVVYADTMASTTAVTSGAALAHGLGAVARRQTRARGRNGHTWISPPGHAAMSLQVWQGISSALPLVQHAAALACVRAIRSQPSYEHLDIRVKWPNDIYYGREFKIGGTISSSTIMGTDVIISIGAGVNIANSNPTYCVNDIIAEHNRKHGAELAPMSVERFLARYCSQLERTLEYMETPGGLFAFIEQYYQYWLHDCEDVLIKSKDRSEPVQGTILGVDVTGWLVVRTERGELRVAPDGSTFNLATGLLVPRL